MMDFLPMTALGAPLAMPALWILMAGCLGTLLTYLFVRVLITRSHRSGLLDRPNERSSHTIPTPRGGGVAFVILFLLSALALQMRQSTIAGAVSFAGWLIPSCALIAVLGFLDDRFSLKASRRLIVQTLATMISLTILFWQLGFNTSFTSQTTLNMAGVLFATFAFFWIVWMTNLYNFMDGIDGYAALEAVIVSLALFAITYSRGLSVASALYFLFAAAVTGFLILNWSPAKIFMGDAGSTFLGFFFAVMAVALQLHGELPIETTIILLGTFIVDSTYTLFVRVARGMKAHVAHRDHAYQHAVQAGWSHRKTVLVFAAITVLWLSPLAAFVAYTERPQYLLREAILIVAFLPLIFLQIRFRAGIEKPI